MRVYDRFIDEYIDEKDINPIAPPERYVQITEDMLIENATRWLADALKKFCDVEEDPAKEKEERMSIEIHDVKELPSAQPNWCDGCKWEYAFGYGECHHCKRNFNDMYEVKDEG